MAIEHEPDDVLLRRGYELMYFSRLLDNGLVTWQRQGLVPAYPPMRGQEAAQVGSALALDRDRDFVFPTYRETGVAVAWGLDLVGYIANHLALWHGGRWDAAESRFAPIQAVVGGSVTHAVGWALGRRLDDAGAVAIAYLGDGASSQGDVHEAMNFAAVLKAPVVFFVQNNKWALSVPLERQVAGGSVATRAAGYGIPGVVVDGDDLEAVYTATREAADRARETGRPSVVEAMTYRRGPHATSDDPGRYRTLDDERGAGPDPLDRLEAVLRERGLADDDWLAAVAAEAEPRLEALRQSTVDARPVPGAEMFDHVFSEPTPQLIRQKAHWASETEHV
jgi:2-oxoisovalerate dehydrogenase E1 component alpha subunit